MNRSLCCLAFLACAAVAQEKAAPSAPGGAVTIDFNALTPGDLTETDEMRGTEAEMKFTIVEENGNRMAELQPQKFLEAGLLLGPLIKGGGTVRAKIFASSKRRLHPRLGVGMHGTGGFRARVVPAQKVIEIAKDDMVLASAPFEWKTDAWFWVEMSVLKSDKGSTVEARAWADGQPRPDKPLVTHAADAAPGTGRASVWGTPYTDKPIRFDDVTVTPAPAA